VTPEPAGGSDDAVEREHAGLLALEEVPERLVDIISYELFDTARAHFGNRAIPWIAETLRATADLIEKLGPPTDA
jgi:hypothetical protein